jgi:O-antigen/teichoic acid export membrane protein
MRRATRVLRNPVAVDVGLLTITQYFSAGFGFIIAIVAARALGPRDYGFAALVMSYPMLVWSLVGVKSMTVTLRYLSGYLATDRREDFQGMCVLGYGLDAATAFGAVMVVAGTSWWVSRDLLDLPGAALWTVVFAASFPFTSLGGTSWAILASLRRFRWLAILQVGTRAMTLAFVLVLLHSGLGRVGLVLASGMGEALGGALMFLTASHALKREGFGAWWTTRKETVWPVKPEFKSFFGWNYLAVTLGTLVSNVPMLLLGGLRGPTEAAFFRLATSVTTVGSYVETSLGRVTYPILSARWAAGDREKVMATLKRWTIRAGLPTGLTLLAAIPLVPILVPLVFGARFEEISTGLQLMLIGTGASAVFFALSPFYYAVGQVRFWTTAYGIYAVLALGVAWAVVGSWGFDGVAASLGLGYLVFNIVMAGLVRPMWRRWNDVGSAPQPPPATGLVPTESGVP